MSSGAVEKVLARLDNVHRNGRDATARCPSHDDRHNSLSISTGDDGRVLLRCHANQGCMAEVIVAKLGLTPADLFEARNGQTAAQRRIVSTYDYRAGSELLYQTVRYHPKDFRQRRPNAGGGWIWNLDGMRRVLYRLPELLAADSDVTVYIVEGEKDAERLAALGLVATSNVGGAGKWRAEYGQVLRGRNVVVIPDNDGPGRAHAEQVARSLVGVAASVKIVELPGLPEHGDASDWLAAGGTPEQLAALVSAAPLFALLASSAQGEDAASAPAFPMDVLPLMVRTYVAEAAAAVGVPGDLVAVPLLAYAAATIGSGKHIELKPGYWQRPILYVAVVAPPGSMKTPAQDAARFALDVLQREAIERYKQELKDYERELEAWQDAPKETRGQKPEKPELEHFFTTDATLEALAVMLEGSPGVVLSRDEIVGWVKSCDAYRGGRGGDRQQWLSLWAGSPLKVDRKKGDPVFVPFPTVCVAGGVQPELLTDLADEAGRRDGFIERILWSYPEVPPTGWTEQAVSTKSQATILELFRGLRWSAETPVRLSRAAREEWVTWYDENARLTAEASGLAQGVYAKLPNQAARLALVLHCLAHPSDATRYLVGRQTMAGAIELAEYFRAHALRVLPRFGDASPARSAGLDGRVRLILVQAGGEWIERTALHRKLSGHVSSEDLSGALARLEGKGLAEQRSVPTGGRPSEQWCTRVLSEVSEESEESAPDRRLSSLSSFVRKPTSGPASPDDRERGEL